MTHVLCLCSKENRHCVADFKFYETVAHEYAVKSTRDLIGSLLEAKHLWPFCDQCNAPSETWFCEVATPAQQQEADSETLIMGGVSTGQ